MRKIKRKRQKTGEFKEFNTARYLESAGVDRRILKFDKKQTIFAQGDACGSVLFIQSGTVKISVVAKSGKEAVVAILGESDFFGEGCIAGQPRRVATATALSPVSVLEINKREMIRVIHEEHEFADRFIAHMLRRNVRVDEDLLELASPS